MNNKDHIIKADFEKIGENYLFKGLLSASKKNYPESMVYFKEGLEYITCDCTMRQWLRESQPFALNRCLPHSGYSNPSIEFNFVKAYLLSFSNDLQQQNEGLVAINLYLNNKLCKYGLYIKSRILASLNQCQNSMDCLLEAKQMGHLPSLNYRLGRLKEEGLYVSGMIELLEAFIENPSSNCSLKALHKNWQKNGKWIKGAKVIIRNNTFSGRIGPLQNLFLWGTGEKFLEAYSKILESEENLSYQSLSKSENVDLVDFLYFITSNKQSILLEKIYKDTHRSNDHWRNDSYDSQDTFNDTYYDDQLDLDQQSPEFWDSL